MKNALMVDELTLVALTGSSAVGNNDAPLGLDMPHAEGGGDDGKMMETCRRAVGGEEEEDTEDEDADGSAADVEIDTEARSDAAVTDPEMEKQSPTQKKNQTRTRGDDDGGNPEMAPSVAKPPGFMERLVREYSLRRDLNALIESKQQQLEQMETLIDKYRAELQRTTKELEADLMTCRVMEEQALEKMQRHVVDKLRRAWPTDLVTNARCLGHLERQRCRLVRQRTELRRAILATRDEECQWMRSAIHARHVQECQELSTALTARKFLEQGSWQATLGIEITPDDPFFANPETLYEANAQAKQFQLQLDSLDALLLTTRARYEALEDRYQYEISANHPVKLAKRSSFSRERRAVETFPSTSQKQELKRFLLDYQRVIASSSSVSRHETQRHRLIKSKQRFARLVADVRTRAGQLLHNFVDKLHDDSRTLVHVWNIGSHEGNSTEDIGGYVARSTSRYFIPYAESRNRMRNQLNDLSTKSNKDDFTPHDALLLYEGHAVDMHQLPPPAVIVAFVRFLTRVVITDYDLVTDSSTAKSLSPTTELDSDTSDKPMAAPSPGISPDILATCVHELVFSRIPRISMACAVATVADHTGDDCGDGEISAEVWEFPHHWYHMKRKLLGLPLTELAFPDDVLAAVSDHFQDAASDVKTQGFLPQTLALFRLLDCELTPRGAMDAIMAAFHTLHHELTTVLIGKSHNPSPCSLYEATTPTLTTSSSGRRRGSSYFISADILIPTIVLIFCHRPHVNDLDMLWRRVQLVQAFRSSVLSDGCEEDYYLTCLTAAMAFIHSFKLSDDQPEEGDPPRLMVCPECVAWKATARFTGIVNRTSSGRPTTPEFLKPGPMSTASPTTSPSSTSSTYINPLVKQESTRVEPRERSEIRAWSTRDPDAIRQLSQWISDQPPMLDASGVINLPVDRFINAHELWVYSRHDR